MTDITASLAVRDPALRAHYALAAMREIPRLLGAMDRNPYRDTYGCLDREYWHYRTSSFPSQMFQEGALPLALVHTTRLPENRWHGNIRVRDLAIAALRFAARTSHNDGSCDDYYPYERALGAAVFSLAAAARAYALLQLDDRELLAWLKLRCHWLMRYDESGHLANHQALAALALLRVGQLTAQREYLEAAADRLDRVLRWQSDEGWFEEYGGADPGYQTITIDCLAKYRLASGDKRLDEPLRRAVAFAHHFLHPDGSYAGEYGSRGTYHFYPHGFELLAPANGEAADLADGFLQASAAGKAACFGDDRMYVHRLANLIEAYLDWSPSRPIARSTPSLTAPSTRYFQQAQLLVRRTCDTHTVVSLARGGVFKHFAGSRTPVTDAGLILETTDGRLAVSQFHDFNRVVQFTAHEEPQPPQVSVSALLHWHRFETATPLKQAIFHLGMLMLGRWCRAAVRRVLQRRLILGRRQAPILHTRTFTWLPQSASFTRGPGLKVTDVVELANPRIRIKRMSFGTDHQTVYVAACGVYQESVLEPWANQPQEVDVLNRLRRVTIVREW